MGDTAAIRDLADDISEIVRSSSPEKRNGFLDAKKACKDSSSKKMCYVCPRCYTCQGETSGPLHTLKIKKVNGRTQFYQTDPDRLNCDLQQVLCEDAGSRYCTAC